MCCRSALRNAEATGFVEVVRMILNLKKVRSNAYYIGGYKVGHNGGGFKKCGLRSYALYLRQK